MIGALIHYDARVKTREEAFWDRVDQRGPDECWHWTGMLSDRQSANGGYGVMPMGTRQTWVFAHRFSYELLVGPIPDGLILDHTCHSGSNCTEVGVNCPHRRCVNPAHLEPVTPAINLARGNKRPPRTHCPKGHRYTRYAGRNVCLVCKNEARRIRRAAGSAW